MTELHVIEPEPAGQSIDDCLQELKQALEEGKLSSLAYAVVYRDGSTGDGWSELPSRVTMLGALDILRSRIKRSHLEDNPT